MPKPSDSAEMSSVIPRSLLEKAKRALRPSLPFKWTDRLNHFYVETRLIFSRSILLLVTTLCIGFLWCTMANDIYQEVQVYRILSVQGILLAILLNMNIWESEREERTFELLIMRIPSVTGLIWFKLRVSLAWILVLSMPFFAGYAFFVGISIPKILGFYAYCMMLAVFTMLLTSVISSFVHQGLATAIVAIIAVYLLLGIAQSLRRVPYLGFCDFFEYPALDYLKQQGLTTLQIVRLIVLSRLLLLAAIAGLYLWLHQRLTKTEKWIG